MATPSFRSMVALPATRERGQWIVRLPDGTRVASPSDAVVRQRVKRLAQASVRFAAISSGLGLEQSVAERPSWQAGERITRRAARRVPISESAGADQDRGVMAHQPPLPADSRSNEPTRHH